MKGQIITNIILVAIIVVMGIILNKTCNRVCDNVKPNSDTTYITDTVTHIIHQTDTKFIVRIHRDTLKLTKVDTIEAIGKYFDRFVYQRSFSDTILEATLFDTITENKATGSLKYKLLKPQTQIITNTQTISKNKAKVYIGFLGVIGKQTQAVIPMLSYSPKSDFMLIHAGYDVINQSYMGGVEFKISLRKQ